jgi:hypothetical protein
MEKQSGHRQSSRVRSRGKRAQTLMQSIVQIRKNFVHTALVLLDTPLVSAQYFRLLSNFLYLFAYLGGLNIDKSPKSQGCRIPIPVKTAG